MLASLIPGDSVSLLNDPLESFPAAVDLREVIVGQFSSLLLHGAFHLLPISFNPVPIHGDLLRATDKQRTGHSVPNWPSR